MHRIPCGREAWLLLTGWLICGLGKLIWRRPIQGNERERLEAGQDKRKGGRRGWIRTSYDIRRPRRSYTYLGGRTDGCWPCSLFSCRHVLAIGCVVELLMEGHRAVSLNESTDIKFTHVRHFLLNSCLSA